ncbi:MAG: hypothetical protein ACP5OA_00850 [Candidatus Woesearchaeota archaeon]
MDKMRYAMIIFVLMIASSIYVCAADPQNDYPTFLDYKNVVNKTYLDEWFFSTNGWWYYNGLAYNSINNIDFKKDFWRQIAPWEYEVCTRSLSTQLTYEDNAGIGSTWSGIYADTITVMAYRRVPERGLYGDTQSLYEVAWYFHPANEDKYYLVKLTNSVTGNFKDIQARTGVNTRNGGSGYNAFYSVDIYDKAVLVDETGGTEHVFDIVNTTDINR